MNIEISLHMCYITIQAEGGSQTYQYFIILFFTLSVEGGRGKVNDAILTLSTVFFILTSSLRCSCRKLSFSNNLITNNLMVVIDILGTEEYLHKSKVWPLLWRKYASCPSLVRALMYLSFNDNFMFSYS